MRALLNGNVVEIPTIQDWDTIYQFKHYCPSLQLFFVSYKEGRAGYVECFYLQPMAEDSKGVQNASVTKR